MSNFTRNALLALTALSSITIGALTISTEASAAGGFQNRRVIIDPQFGRPNWRHPNWRRPHWRHPNWHGHWRRPIYYAAPTYIRPVSVAPVAVAPRCNCLTKEYTPEGNVLFRDLCTNEAALAARADMQAQVQPQPQMAPAPAPAPQPR